MVEIIFIVSKKFRSHLLCTSVIHDPDVVEVAADVIEVAKNAP
jgi:hypothetical protein